MKKGAGGGLREGDEFGLDHAEFGGSWYGAGRRMYRSLARGVMGHRGGCDGRVLGPGRRQSEAEVARTGTAREGKKPAVWGPGARTVSLRTEEGRV